MNIDFNEFLRIMSVILIVLLIIQGLDYIFGFGVNNYLFIMFCIAFAFTMGAIYHNIIETEKKKNLIDYEKSIGEKLDNIQNGVEKEYLMYGLTNEVLDSQVKLNELRNGLDEPDKLEMVDGSDYVQ